ncbi:MAG TPA: HdeD family acid-resistance protein [Hyphomicrobium sp.]|jgi:uncharacterized membrane protein HdeD (DUF308 family)|nr:HdeD family acid-resistance protein [Hyphomicrobium sp.]
MPVAKDIAPRLYEKLAQRNDQLFWGGVALAVVGVLALIFPVAATFAVAVMVGWLLVLAGAVTIWDAFTVEGTGPFFGELLIGLLKLAFGVYLLRHPDVSMIALTLLLAAVFMIDGAIQVVLAFELRPMDGWIWMLLAGLVSIGVALLIAAELPEISLVALGIYLGISFLATGIARIAISRRISAFAQKV